MRKSWHFQKVSLDDWEISILSLHHLPVPKVSTEIEKSVKTWNFWRILAVCLNLDWELVIFIKISQFVKIFEPEVPQKVSIMLRLISKSLDKSQKSWPRHKKFWSQHNGQSQRFSKVGLDRSRNLDLDWSQLLRPPGLLSLLPSLTLVHSCACFFLSLTFNF